MSLSKADHKEKWRIKVPASTANLGSGFDSIGIAFQLYITVEMELAAETHFIWQGDELSSCVIPDKDNLILMGMDHVFAACGENRPHFQFTVHSEIPLTRGLGSSASALVAGLVLANEYLGQPLSLDELLWMATEIEGHPDNVGASLFGGVFIATVDWDKKKVFYHSFPFPEEWRWVAAIPSYTLSTSLARNILPKSYTISDAVYNVSRYGILVSSLLTRNREGVTFGLEDSLHQPYRKQLIPGFESLLEQREELGALGFVISGAGPTVLGLLAPDTDEERVKTAMERLMLINSHAIEVKRVEVENQGFHFTSTRK